MKNKRFQIRGAVDIHVSKDYTIIWKENANSTKIKTNGIKGHDIMQETLGTKENFHCG